MADRIEGVVRRAGMAGIAGAGAWVFGAALLGLGAPTAAADELIPDPSAPSSASSAEGGVRNSGDAGRSATQGEQRGSMRAVPAGTPMPVVAEGPGIGIGGIGIS